METKNPVNPFTPRANLIARALVVSFFFLGALLTCVGFAYNRSDFATGVGVDIPQPIPFSHAHHVTGLGIDCRYCHESAEYSAFAGMPSTDTCMNCHWQLWTEAAMLAPLRDSWRGGQPIAWRRVHDLPDFVYFDHSIHLAKGIGCSECHGRVDLMPLVHRTQPLSMQWCLDCHRDPLKRIRPVSEIYNMTWEPRALQPPQFRELAAAYDIEPPSILTDCSICHR